MYRVGLTGGIGSGKSTVAGLFAARGVKVIDSDRIARELVEPDRPALAEIAAAFGRGVLQADGRLDRRALRALIFADEDARRRLEAILHPRIQAVLHERSARATSPYVMLVIPLLVESGWRSQVDHVLVVDCSPETQVRRVMARDVITETAAREILAAQAGRADRLAAADTVIHNEDGDDLESQVLRLDALYRREAASRTPPG